MDTLGPAAESLRLSQHYRQMTDEELVEIARDRSQLTHLAQQALDVEFSQRRLVLPTAAVKMPKFVWRPEQEGRKDGSESVTDSDAAADPYAEERELVELCRVWSLDDALQLQALLDRADIPFVMGLEKAARAELVTSNFAGGVPVGIMRVGWPWARRAMQNYAPKHVPAGEEDPEWDNESPVAIRCPKCHSNDVIFDELADAPATENTGSGPKFKWTCASCGYEWEDEGVES